MGGDFAPGNEVAGAIEALRQERNAFEVILVGKEEEIRAQLKAHDTEGLSYLSSLRKKSSRWMIHRRPL